MADTSNNGKKTLSLGGGKKPPAGSSDAPETSSPSDKKSGTLSLKGSALLQANQKLSGGRSRTVAVEVRRTRGAGPIKTPEQAAPVVTTEQQQAAPQTPLTAAEQAAQSLSTEERDNRLKALQKALEEEKTRQASDAVEEKPDTQIGKLSKVEQLKQEVEELEKANARAAEAEAAKAAQQPQQSGPRVGSRVVREAPSYEAPVVKIPGRPAPTTGGRAATDDDDGTSYRDRLKRGGANKKNERDDDNNNAAFFRGGKLTVNQVLNEQYERERNQSLAAVRRKREKARAAAGKPKEAAAKVFREVTLPETITVQELANRMTERAPDVIKALMRMGVMATINQVIDADTAELLVMEFGHKVKRVTESDIEEGIEGDIDTDENLQSRPPIVTVMGHVDHGKTSLLDALRSTDVVSREAGGITQHIGAYQVTLESGAKVTFLDTPGHAAFSEMRARGANVTDIVILVVAANDSIMPQTIEAINHAKAAKVPMIVAINKIDLPDANPMKVKQDLLQHEVIIEDMGGDTQAVEVSAKKRMNLDKLIEAVLLQAEVLDLKANPERQAVGTVVEAKLEQGRGSVATVLVEKGTLKIGDIFVVGAETGRVRALVNDKGQQIPQALPGQPVEVLGLAGTPEAGDRLVVVEDEAKARNIADHRISKKREAAAVIGTGTKSFEALLAQAKDSNKKELQVIVKADVHGSLEAIVGSVTKLAEDSSEIGVRVIHTGVGGITESDITLAKSSNAMVIGFNVRANAQARDQAQKNGVNISYYNIIYNVIDDIKAILGGMLSPTIREEYLGQAEIRQVFNITKAGKIAGCMVTTGMVKRGSKVRLLRDNVVIHEGMLKTLKRFKDEVKEVKEGNECGMAFENYEDIREGDIIECFDVVSEARTL
ncbi:MAG: translation initiation factor IF-2 [Alphaproteobacteria bacterium]|nr:translation initiation factor IF-2 [Alphaproteobacteria bacterium]